MEDKIKELEKRIAELERRPVFYPVPCYPVQPAPVDPFPLPNYSTQYP